MRRPAFLFLGFLLLSGCVTMGGGSSMLLVQTDPAGALLTIDGVGECETPCRIRLDGPKKAKIAKAGFVAKDYMLSPGKSEVTIPLELAAASDDVDATALPDIE
ncbi:PEGA domain-containing protein [Hyphococcus sp.]|uniref:PEGA domain-containing protein n=1 Tax=Hyphococcus sp. TaxID=2038636 RepID=UPI003D150D0C